MVCTGDATGVRGAGGAAGFGAGAAAVVAGSLFAALGADPNQPLCTMPYAAADATEMTAIAPPTMTWRFMSTPHLPSAARGCPQCLPPAGQCLRRLLRRRRSLQMMADILTSFWLPIHQHLAASPLIFVRNTGSLPQKP
jgi:hypothetical protein